MKDLALIWLGTQRLKDRLLILIDCGSKGKVEMVNQRLRIAILTAAMMVSSWYGLSTMSLAQPLEVRLGDWVKQGDNNADGAWVPVDRIDPDRPAAVVLINDSNVMLEYAFSTTEQAPLTLGAGETTILTNVPIPSTLLVNALTPTATLDFAFGLSPLVDEPDNATTVTISSVDPQFNTAGFSAIDIHETGALYRY